MLLYATSDVYSKRLQTPTHTQPLANHMWGSTRRERFNLDGNQLVLNEARPHSQSIPIIPRLSSAHAQNYAFFMSLRLISFRWDGPWFRASAERFIPTFPAVGWLRTGIGARLACLLYRQVAFSSSAWILVSGW